MLVVFTLTSTDGSTVMWDNESRPQSDNTYLSMADWEGCIVQARIWIPLGPLVRRGQFWTDRRNGLHTSQLPAASWSLHVCRSSQQLWWLVQGPTTSRRMGCSSWHHAEWAKCRTALLLSNVLGEMEWIEAVCGWRRHLSDPLCQRLRPLRIQSLWEQCSWEHSAWSVHWLTRKCFDLQQQMHQSVLWCGLEPTGGSPWRLSDGRPLLLWVGRPTVGDRHIWGRRGDSQNTYQKSNLGEKMFGG